MTSHPPPSPSDELDRLLAAARGARANGRPEDALAAAWRALELAPGEVEAKRLLSNLLRDDPRLARPERREILADLLADPQIDPLHLASAGWHAVLAAEAPSAAAEAPEAFAFRAEADRLALRLLEQVPVSWPEAETALTRLRRWLLLSGRWSEFPRLVEALRVQAMLNGGAWLRDDEEQAALEAAPDTPIAAAYSPPSPSAADGSSFADPVTRVVAEQYRSWPYPFWSRVVPPRPTTLPDRVAGLDGGRPSGLPVDADILVAGCGVGREAALMALTFPDAKVVAVDLSEASLAFARERCAAAGIRGVDFRQLDLHRIADLGMSFHFITCSGVLHHLPDPEVGWAALTAVLRPGGVMRVMLYSIAGRQEIKAAQGYIADLLDRPIDENLLRAVRRRLMEKAPGLLANAYDFYTLAGLHDLLLHRHEDPFDVPRIKRAIDSLGLELLGFTLPTPHDRALYLREHPHDPRLRDVETWARLERTAPFLFAGMHKFWCRKKRR
jgi:SAM-dependent methyltransferase